MLASGGVLSAYAYDHAQKKQEQQYGYRVSGEKYAAGVGMASVPSRPPSPSSRRPTLPEFPRVSSGRRAGTVATTTTVEHAGYRPGSMAERLGSSSLRQPVQAATYLDASTAVPYSSGMGAYEPAYSCGTAPAGSSVQRSSSVPRNAVHSLSSTLPHTSSSGYAVHHSTAAAGSPGSHYGTGSYGPAAAGSSRGTATGPLGRTAPASSILDSLSQRQPQQHQGMVSGGIGGTYGFSRSGSGSYSQSYSQQGYAAGLASAAGARGQGPAGMDYVAPASQGLANTTGNSSSGGAARQVRQRPDSGAGARAYQPYANDGAAGSGIYGSYAPQGALAASYTSLRTGSGMVAGDVPVSASTYSRPVSASRSRLEDAYTAGGSTYSMQQPVPSTHFSAAAAAAAAAARPPSGSYYSASGAPASSTSAAGATVLAAYAAPDSARPRASYYNSSGASGAASSAAEHVGAGAGSAVGGTRSASVDSNRLRRPPSGSPQSVSANGTGMLAAVYLPLSATVSTPAAAAARITEVSAAAKEAAAATVAAIAGKVDAKAPSLAAIAERTASLRREASPPVPTPGVAGLLRSRAHTPPSPSSPRGAAAAAAAISQQGMARSAPYPTSPLLDRSLHPAAGMAGLRTSAMPGPAPAGAERASTAAHALSRPNGSNMVQAYAPQSPSGKPPTSSLPSPRPAAVATQDTLLTRTYDAPVSRSNSISSTAPNLQSNTSSSAVSAQPRTSAYTATLGSNATMSASSSLRSQSSAGTLGSTTGSVPRSAGSDQYHSAGLNGQAPVMDTDAHGRTAASNSSSGYGVPSRGEERVKDSDRHREGAASAASRRSKELARMASCSVQFPSPRPVLVPAREAGRGCVGLANLGNTCFMNSILQSLAAVPELAGCFLQPDHAWGSKASVAPAFADLLGTLTGGSLGTVYTPSSFLKRIGRVDSRWSEGAQQDSQEFMHALLEVLQEECNRARGKPSYRELKGEGPEEAQAAEAATYAREWHDSVVDDVFGGLLQSTLQCTACGRQSHRFDPFVDLALPIPAKQSRSAEVSIADCLAAFSEEEKLDGSDSYKCEACKRCQPHTKRLQVYHYPRVLVLTLKRFSQRPATGLFGRLRGASKNTTPVFIDASQLLDVSPYCNAYGLCSTAHMLPAGPSGSGGRPGQGSQMAASGVNGLRPLYQLIAVSHHSGSLEGGHYTAQARAYSDGAWYTFNDSHVRKEAGRPGGASGSAYVLFYRLAQLHDPATPAAATSAL